MTALAAVGTVATPRRERGAPMIRVEGLVKRFAVRRRMIDAVRDPRGTRWVTAVDHVSLAAGEGEILGLLGPNGAGKTTLVKILSTLVTPDAGVAEVGGFDVVREGARARHVLAPVAADERSLDWRLSATENLRFFGALHGLHGDALRTRAEAVLERVGLADAGRKLVGAFSSGMKQRLLIGRALLSRPRVLLLDEPTRSLDPLSARAFRTFLREEVVGREGCTILLATHDHEEALELCDRIAIMGRGRLLALDTPAAVAREFGESRYRAWTTAPEHAAFGRVVADGGAARVLAAREPDGTAVVDLALPPGVDDPTETLSALVFAGAPIARFERVQPTLADIMERVLHRHERGADA